MLGAEDLVCHSGPRNPSGHCSLEPFSNAGEKRYRSPGAGRCLVCLPCLRYHCHLSQLPLCWEVVELEASLEDSSYEFPNLSPAGTKQSHSRAVSAWRGAGDSYRVSFSFF